MFNQIQLVPLKDIKVYDRNPRKHGPEQVKQIAQSLRTYGWVIPIVLDRNMTLIAGHGRVMAAKSIGMETAEARIMDTLTDEQAKAYRIADNKLAEHSVWDVDMLAREMAELEALGFDLSATGHNEVEIFSLTAHDTPDEQDDVQKLWEESGMPDFKNENLETFNLTIHFPSLERRQELCKQLGFDITDTARTAYWPPEEYKGQDQTAHLRIMSRAQDGGDEPADPA